MSSAPKRGPSTTARLRAHASGAALAADSVNQSYRQAAIIALELETGTTIEIGARGNGR